MIYNELMSDFEMDEKDFAADSWSLAVDSNFLQQHKKEVMKQQDVIYGEPRRPPQTSLLSPVLFLCVLPLPAPTSQDPSLLSHWPSRPCLASPQVATRPPPFGLLTSKALLYPFLPVNS